MLVEQIRPAVPVLLAVKVEPFFSSMANIARRLIEAGANALVLFNRFYQPDVEHRERLDVFPADLALPNSDELRLVLRWIAIVHGRVGASLAATTGVHTAEDVINLVLAGADVHHDGLRFAPSRPGPPRHRAGTGAVVVRGAGVRFDRGGQREPEPATRSRSGFFRAGKLHEDSGGVLVELVDRGQLT